MPKADTDHTMPASLAALIARSATLGEVLNTTVLDAAVSHRLYAELATVDRRILRTQALTEADKIIKLELAREAMMIAGDSDWALLIIDSLLADMRSSSSAAHCRSCLSCGKD